MGLFAERFVEKPRHKGRSYWGGVQARLVFSPLLPAPLPLLTTHGGWLKTQQP
ncbi:MAG: hypothetical protein KME50_04190 [Nostoc desertorum CM1-VF14]|jgi:hypothetical protein|nr:hypothetical protein [Nostoc desertorum CM1-VF14]